MAKKKTLHLTQSPLLMRLLARKSVLTAFYGTDEKQTEGKHISIPKHGFFAAKLSNFDGFPEDGTLEVGEGFNGFVCVLNKARITPTVTVNHEKDGLCLLVAENAYVTDAHFTGEHWGSSSHVRDNAIVRGGKHQELVVNNNGYIDGNTVTTETFVTDSARLINAGVVRDCMFGGDTEVNLTSVSTGEVSAATELLALGALEWNLGKTLPLHSNKETPHIRTASPQTMWGAMYEQGQVWYLAHTAMALKEAPVPSDATLCLASTLHKKQREHCKCMFYYALYLLADPVALQYFARLEGNTLDTPTLLENEPYSFMEEYMANRIIEFDAACSRGETTGQAIFDENLTISVEQVKQMRGFQRLVAELKNFNRPASFDDPTNELLWYLNYIHVTYGITAEQFFSKGLRKDKPNKAILEMTARARGII